jgi:hypothetical protein
MNYLHSKKALQTAWLQGFENKMVEMARIELASKVRTTQTLRV